jgi:hypothetical protein
MKTTSRIWALIAIALAVQVVTASERYIVPLRDMNVPLGTGQYLGPAVPTSDYPLIMELPNGYLVKYVRGDQHTIGWIPGRDSMGNSVADVEDDNVRIRTVVRASVYEGVVTAQDWFTLSYCQRRNELIRCRVSFRYLCCCGQRR